MNKYWLGTVIGFIATMFSTIVAAVTQNAIVYFLCAMPGIAVLLFGGAYIANNLREN